ncbi:MAG: hypothetical protein MUP69_10430 [Candidatus Atribacteria bacterium]|nr:hypothetical protein [Candidatus Atribacteria bacterium]
MLITNILLGIITFILINILGGICDIQNKVNVDYIKLKKYSDSFGPIIRKVKDEKKI